MRKNSSSRPQSDYHRKCGPNLCRWEASSHSAGSTINESIVRNQPPVTLRRLSGLAPPLAAILTAPGWVSTDRYLNVHA